MDLELFKGATVTDLLEHSRRLDINNREKRLQCDAVGFLFNVDGDTVLVLGDAANLKNIQYRDHADTEHHINITKYNTSIEAIDRFINRHQIGQQSSVSLGFGDVDSAIWLMSKENKLSDKLIQSDGVDYIIENHEKVTGIVFIKTEYQNGIRLGNNVEVSVIPERSELILSVNLY